MAKLIWGADGERFFEAGVDRGVLYVPGLPGVAWNGLRAVKEAPTGGSPEPLYLDGLKYSNVASAEEFNATLDALSSPPEFAVCDGSVRLAAGLTATQQPRKTFNLSYRTRVGNDLKGIDGGYKIHLVYNALAAPASRDHNSLNDSVDVMTLSWDVSTRPPRAAFGYKPTAHFVIDTRETSAAVIQAIEDILYGSANIAPSMPTIAELVALIERITHPVVSLTPSNFANGTVLTADDLVTKVYNYGSSPLVVTDGYLTHVPSAGLNSAGYAQLYLPAKINYASITGKFPTTVYDDGVIALVVGNQDWSDGSFDPAATHFTFNSRKWTYTIWTGSTGEEYVAGGEWNLDISQDHTVEMTYDGNTVTVSLPDGTTRVLSDPRFSSLRGGFINGELFESDGRIHAPAKIKQFTARGSETEPLVAWPPSLSGVVTSNGVPLSGASVYLFANSEYTYYLGPITTAIDGRYQMDTRWPGPGTYRVFVQPNNGGADFWYNGPNAWATTWDAAAPVQITGATTLNIKTMP